MKPSPQSKREDLERRGDAIPSPRDFVNEIDIEARRLARDWLDRHAEVAQGSAKALLTVINTTSARREKLSGYRLLYRETLAAVKNEMRRMPGPKLIESLTIRFEKLMAAGADFTETVAPSDMAVALVTAALLRQVRQETDAKLYVRVYRNRRP